MPSFESDYISDRTREPLDSQQTKMSSFSLLRDEPIPKRARKDTNPGLNELVREEQIQFGDSTAELYGQKTPQEKIAPALPEAIQPFSPAEISKSGEYTAELLRSKNMRSGESIEIILSRDNPQQLAQDVAEYEESGAAGGVQQGGLDDCWFQVSVAALSTTTDGPERISQMITRTENGEYQVTFPGDPLDPVVVSEKDVDNNPDISDSAKWARVLEAAILKKDPKRAIAREKGGKGGNTNDGLRLLTGNEPSEIHLADTDVSAMSATLQQNLKDGRAIVASTPSSTQEPIEYSHAYSVTAYDGNAKTITLRNPWGYNEALPGTKLNGISVGGAGEISMPLDIFMKNFHKIDVA